MICDEYKANSHPSKCRNETTVHFLTIPKNALRRAWKLQHIKML